MNTLYSFDPKNYIQSVYDYCLDKAKKNKLWAEQKNKELNGKEWSSASEMSQDMLKEYTEKSVEEIAIDHYKYFQMRSHAMGTSFGSIVPIDREAFNKWKELTGKEPVTK